MQNQYYSERQSYDFFPKDPEDAVIWNSCYVTDEQLIQTLSTNETCQKTTEYLFNKKISKIQPDYLIVHIFEPVFTPQWAYNYPQKYNLTVVQAYAQNNQPTLIIYKFPDNFNFFELQ